MPFLEITIQKVRSRYLYTESVILDPAGQPELRNTVRKLAGDGSYLLSFIIAKTGQENGDKGVGKKGVNYLCRLVFEMRKCGSPKLGKTAT